MTSRLLALPLIVLAACGSAGAPAPGADPVESAPAPVLRPPAAAPDGTARLASHERSFGEITDGELDRIEPGRAGGVTIRGVLPGVGASGSVVMLLLRYDADASWPGMVMEIDSRLDRTGGTAELRLRNWRSTKVELVDRWTVGTAAGRHTVDLRGRREHIGEDGRIEVYLAYMHRQPFATTIDAVRLREASGAAAPASPAAPRTAPPPPPPPAPTVGRRLLHYQTIGFSHESKLGRVAPNVCTRRDGWSGYIRKTLRPLVDRLGAGSFDW
ncbi:MAG: hypothetical protein ACYTGP_12975, partial [Planctomycetota bacterium]